MATSLKVGKELPLEKLRTMSNSYGETSDEQQKEMISAQDHELNISWGKGNDS